MIIPLENQRFDTRIIPSDWRYSASIVGLLRYFRWNGIDHEMGDDYVDYNRDDAIGPGAEEKYLRFAEDYFKSTMHHRVIEDILENDELTPEQVKLCNDELTKKTVSGVLGKLEYTPESREELLRKINENRLELIKNIFLSYKGTYESFLNSSPNILTKGGKISRLQGYHVDTARKTKTIAYCFDKDTYVYQDEPEFDYIPFAFSRTDESFFINNNIKIDLLLKSNDRLQDVLNRTNEESRRSPYHYLFLPSKDAAAFINYDVEVIKKYKAEGYYETMFVRSGSVEIFEKISKKHSKFVFPFKVKRPGVSADNKKRANKEKRDPNYIYVEEIVTNGVINRTFLDGTIETLLKANKSNNYYLISVLIDVNELINGGKNMDAKFEAAVDTAQDVEEYFSDKKAENKLNSYKQKLISAITFKDYDRFSEVLLQLSAYTGVPFDFAYDLFEDFETNKNIAYAFINRLNGKGNNTEEEK